MYSAGIYHTIKERSVEKQRQFAVLVDPDSQLSIDLEALVKLSVECKVDYFFVGGSLMSGGELNECVSFLKAHTNIPVILFPGSVLQINDKADAILFLSLISGRNPELLIGNHVIVAPYLKKTSLEVLSTGYMLVDSGKQTTASYISGSSPIPYDKPDIAACTAMAGEMLGMKLIYMDGGSGAAKPVSEEMIKKVRKSVHIPLIIGGGIDSKEKALKAFDAGADVIVVGNAIERNNALIPEIANAIHS